MQQPQFVSSQFHAADPFGMLIDPLGAQRALAATQQRLESLNRRICRPLDRVATPLDAKPAADRDAFDAAIEHDDHDD